MRKKRKWWLNHENWWFNCGEKGCFIGIEGCEHPCTFWNLGVSTNGGFPKSSIFMVILYHPFWGTRICGTPHICCLSSFGEDLHLSRNLLGTQGAIEKHGGRSGGMMTFQHFSKHGEVWMKLCNNESSSKHVQNLMFWDLWDYVGMWPTLPVTMLIDKGWVNSFCYAVNLGVHNPCSRSACLESENIEFCCVLYRALWACYVHGTSAILA